MQYYIFTPSVNTAGANESTSHIVFTYKNYLNICCSIQSTPLKHLLVNTDIYFVLAFHAHIRTEAKQNNKPR